MIDLHTHTNESDGTYSPVELVEAAVAAGLEALGITDHDTFAGYNQAAPVAVDRGLDLVCGVELSTRTARSENGRERRWDVHLLGYFVHEPPSFSFREWLVELLASRRERNARLVEKLQSMGVSIDLAEVETLGRTLTGRPHFARVLVNKGYAANHEDAFRRYLGESAPGYVFRESPPTAMGIQQVQAAGGISVLAHPVRLGIRDARQEEAFIADLRDAGLRGIEVYHSDHRPADVDRYTSIAKKYGLAMTGGSDFHGAVKPNVRLGTGIDGKLAVPLKILAALKKTPVV